VTRRGVEAAVLVPIDQWRRLEQAARPTLKDLLLAESPRAEIPVPPRRDWRRRAPTAVEETTCTSSIRLSSPSCGVRGPTVLWWPGFKVSLTRIYTSRR